MHEEMTPFPCGVDALTGELIREPELEELSRRLLENSGPITGRRMRGTIDGVDASDLAQAGWGILFAESDPRSDEILEALKPLLDHRRAQAGSLYRQYVGTDGYCAGDRKLDFLARHGAGPGPVDPNLVPYYLLLVGDPEQIPFGFQYGLDHQHAVGRIFFETLEEYRSYAASVVAAETAPPQPGRKVTFFGPAQDDGTRVSLKLLLSPLIEGLRGRQDCKIHGLLGEHATKSALSQLLHGEERPNLLFTAGHGVYYKTGHPGQQARQGALICQDWPGEGCAPGPEHVFAAEDVNGARLQGLLAFLFACNSAGTPDRGDFAPEDGYARQASPRPFVSSLSQKLLGRGALAVVGHVERVWRCSFLWRETGARPQAFMDTLGRLLDGKPLGWAMEPLSARFADLAACLGSLLEDHYLGLLDEEKSIIELWTACRDARNYVIVGDPAVRLFTPTSPAPPPRIMRDGSMRSA